MKNCQTVMTITKADTKHIKKRFYVKENIYIIKYFDAAIARIIVCGRAK